MIISEVGQEEEKGNSYNSKHSMSTFTSTKKLLNEAVCAVSEAIEGVVLTQSQTKLRRLGGLNVLYRPRTQVEMDTHVALISGGGSGHEPAHWGYVGEGTQR